MIQTGCCDICGIPLDAEYFDEAGFVSGSELPRRGERVVLVSFRVHPQYCGVLQCFSQFTDAYMRDNSEARTPGLTWMILRNDQPVAPYHRIESIQNPWGYGSYGFQIRLDENAKVEFVLHNRSFDFGVQEHNDIDTIGGRIMGRYWYNQVYGSQTTPRSLAAERG